eukprot:TRINITY_DN63697_c0_g1_i1.p1 TRINITY_DN63697_c0_g1~~TRINITY_DN63697_c0_g1_i1.p1  ORF type:complete len:302 (+),score=23.35 TRINITY_DN63697_c0_g1_i1:79-984(+)
MFGRLCLAWTLWYISHSRPFEYDPEDARRFASLASIPYCEQLESVLDWTCSSCKDSKTRLVPGTIKILNGDRGNTSRILVGKLRDQRGCLMSFRGSDNIENWIRNFETWDIRAVNFEDCDQCRVHDGFYHVWKNLRQMAVDALHDIGCTPHGADSLLYITGHSLGAALTHIAMFTLENAGYRVAKTYSYGAPRVGNSFFSEAFSARFLQRVPVFRITHHMDPVPHLPPEALGFVHVQEEVYYDEGGNFTVCPSVEDPACADQFWDLPSLILLHAADHCRSPLVPGGDICNPSCGNSNQVIV